jgi:gluconate transporter
MPNAMVLVHLGIAIAMILVLILKLRINPVISLFLGSLYMGVASGLGAVATVGAITEGFGGLLRGIGLSVGFGIMLGQLIADSGAVQSIANKLLNLTKEEGSDYALGVTGLIVSTPVFYDVGYVILAPLARTLAKSVKTLPHFVGAMVAGLGIAHTFIPPTPGPMTGSELLKIELGVTMLWGIIVAVPTFFLSMWIYEKFFLGNASFWDPKTDEDSAFKEAESSASLLDTKELPSFGISIIPIFLPVFLILLGTTIKALYGSVPGPIQFLSDRNIAMLVGVFAAIFLASQSMSKEKIEESINVALGSAGIVLLITGAGGGLGNVLGKAGVGQVLTEIMGSLRIHPLLLTWVIAALLKIAQGSGTVAMITAVGIVAPAVPTMGIPAILVALAAFSGSLMGAHVNDSGFWITAKVAGLSTSGGLKTYTMVCALQSMISIILIMALSAIL